MKKADMRKSRLAVYFQPFSRLYEQFEGNTFVQLVIDKLYQEGICYFSRKEALGSRIVFSLQNVGIPYEIEKVDDATMKVMII